MDVDDWRRHGRRRRKTLLQHDQAQGGRSFALQPNVSIHRYFGLADRVITQFREMYSNPTSMEECYVMGNRLLIFLAETLPSHPTYRSEAPDISKLRTQSRKDLHSIHKRLELVAMRIDEDQLNQYVLSNLDRPSNRSRKEENRTTTTKMQEAAPSPSPTNVSFENDEVAAPQQEWEAFDGWDVTMKEAANTTEWHEFGASFDEDMAEPLENRQDDQSNDEIMHQRTVSPDHYASNVRYELPPTILDQIANDEVCYEYDSEAVDSWAQDSEIDEPAITTRVQPPEVDNFESILNTTIDEAARPSPDPDFQPAPDPDIQPPEDSEPDSPEAPFTPHHRPITDDKNSGYSPDYSASSSISSLTHSPTISPNKENNKSRRVRFNEEQNKLNFYTPEQHRRKRTLILPRPETLTIR
eukprot:CAMPEP_0194037962 /NCGR_PEP_ID=MMETSP0009_2-20130614/10259_1 /TAXON_ID=210454 /ORGANISM="Grammatophora oceanica, Strain CCMP 410" /LENGTH=411 /DNA_ID=CAMNT_0038680315 /DNA_START=87 /DNA_END=1322 /DNA_ORIENTATION=-